MRDGFGVMLISRAIDTSEGCYIWHHVCPGPNLGPQQRSKTVTQRVRSQLLHAYMKLGHSIQQEDVQSLAPFLEHRRKLCQDQPVKQGGRTQKWLVLARPIGKPLHILRSLKFIASAHEDSRQGPKYGVSDGKLVCLMFNLQLSIRFSTRPQNQNTK